MPEEKLQAFDADSIKLTLHFNPKEQTVRLEFNPAEFKTWDMVLAVLGMGLEEGKFRLALKRQEGLQRMAMEQMQQQALAQQVFAGAKGHKRVLES